MATFANALSKIASLLTSNSNREITAAKHREVENEIVQAISESVTEGQIPVMVGGKHVGYATLKFDPTNKELQLEEFKLKYGASRVNYIYNSGVYTGNATLTIPTKFYVDRRRVVVGVITDNINLGTGLRVGDSVTLEGGTAHTVAAGDCFLLQGQTEPTENVPWEAVAADAVPIRPDWYDKNKNLEILIETGDIKRVLPASGEGDPVARPDSGKLAFNFFAINNF